MSASRSFFDSNVLVCMFDADAPRKQELARGRFDDEAGVGRAVLSTQVLQEFYVSVTRKLARPLASEDAEETVRELSALSVVRIDPPIILAAIRLARDRQISFWDALIVCSASEAGCDRLLSEDLGHGTRFGRLTVVNPFRDEG